MLRSWMIVMLGVLCGCTYGPKSAVLAAANGSSLGENGDTNMMRVPVGTAIEVTVDCRQATYPRGSDVIGTPNVASDDASVLSVTQVDGDTFALRGETIGETLLRASGECEDVFPVRVVPSQ